MRILVTGATGFIGRTLSPALARYGHVVVGLSRRPAPGPPPAIEGVDAWQRVDAPTAVSAWSAALQDTDAVVHLAARVHRMTEQGPNSAQAYQRDNVDSTRALAEAAALAGVHRLVFMSTVKVLGECSARTHVGGWQPFTEADPPRPADPYAKSKWEAEQALAAQPGLESVVVRPPLVYGPGVGANFLALMRAVDRGVPLPLGAVDNLRSLVSVQNLSELVHAALTDPRAANRCLLVSDLQLSTPDLVRALGRALGRRPRLWSVPPPLLRAGASLLGRRPAVDRLLESLVVDGTQPERLLDWRPAISPEQALAETAQWYRALRAHRAA